MIIAVDYDGTLVRDKELNLPLIRWLKGAQRAGDTVILWTCRERQSLNEAMLLLRSNGLVPNYVNCNPPQVIKRFGYDPRKIFADIYIDDKAQF